MRFLKYDKTLNFDENKLSSGNFNISGDKLTATNNNDDLWSIIQTDFGVEHNSEEIDSFHLKLNTQA